MEPTPDRSTTMPELPSLDPGVCLLDGATRGALHALVVDHCLLTDGRVYWLDSHGHATTQPLRSLAPGERLLDRVRVARGFTAFQHAALAETLTERIEDPDEPPALVVAPALDGRYREADLPERERRALLLRTVARLAGLARRHEVPVLVTRREADGFAAPVERAAAATVRCERTRAGLRFTAEEFETLVYPVGDGAVQTTLAFWREVLAARHPVRAAGGESRAPREVTASGAH